MFTKWSALISGTAGFVFLATLLGFASSVCAMKPVPPGHGECFYLKSQYTQYWKAYQQALRNSERTRDPARREKYVQHAHYCRKQAGYFRHQYEQRCLGKPPTPPVEVKPSQPPPPKGEWICWSGMGRHGFCRKNGCHPQECFWENSATKQRKYDHRPTPAGGWTP